MGCRGRADDQEVDLGCVGFAAPSGTHVEARSGHLDMSLALREAVGSRNTNLELMDIQTAF